MTRVDGPPSRRQLGAWNEEVEVLSDGLESSGCVLHGVRGNDVGAQLERVVIRRARSAASS